MCVDPVTLTAIGTTVSAAGSVYGGIAARQAGNAQAKYYRQSAQEERRLAAIDEAASRRETRAVLGAQAADAAASGIALDSGSALELLEESVRIGERNALAIRAGGQQRARGLEAQASFAKTEGRNAMIGSFLTAAGQLVGGFGEAGYMKRQLKVGGVR